MKLSKKTALLLEAFHTEVHNYSSRQSFSMSTVNQVLLADMRAAKEAFRNHLLALEAQARIGRHLAKRAKS